MAIACIVPDGNGAAPRRKSRILSSVLSSPSPSSQAGDREERLRSRVRPSVRQTTSNELPNGINDAVSLSLLSLFQTMRHVGYDASESEVPPGSGP